MEYDVSINSKGQFVLPKEVREKFQLSTGSKLKIIVDEEIIILKPRTIADELHDLILDDMVKEGKAVNQKNIRECKIKLNKAFDDMVDAVNQELARKEYLSLNDLKSGNDRV